MMICPKAALALACLAGLSATTVRADEAIAKQAKAFLEKYCFRCHGGVNDKGKDIKVLNRDVLVRPPKTKKRAAYITPGKPAESLVWQYMGVPEYAMPPDEELQPSVEERQIIEKWIIDGAQFPKEVVRTPVDDRTALTAVRDHLKSLSAADRPYQRYLSLNDLHNNKTIAAQTLRVHRAAASKLVNSLSWQPEIVVPEKIKGTEDTILNIDLRKLGWSADDWRAIATFYPYGVTHPEDESFRELESEIGGLTRFRLSVLRVDWFVVTVSRPPLYDQLLRLPKNLRDLELKLNVRLEENFDRDILRRGGLIFSGVSRHNRLVERHPTPFGAYWRSYDFGSSGGDGNLVLKPLGPKFPGNRFDDQAFVQAGGEVIFHLPNGLQGYMLARADDTRLDGPAPIAIVRDHEETAGTPEVVNGLSCINCHRIGMNTFEDQIRKHPAVFADARIKMERLYPTIEEMNLLLEKDNKRFLDALSLAIGPFLLVSDGAETAARELIEPVGKVAQLYNQDLTPESVAAELDMPDVAKIQAKLGEAKFQELGLGPLLDARAVKRELWESSGQSLYHRVANELGLARNQVQ
jgi:hypothetical protein